MIILGIDTATPQVGCALGGHEGTIASTHSSKGRRHAESLVPQIQFICQQAQVELSEVAVIAVDVGPGLFTGMRVGLATAKSLAYALGIPMVGVSSLDLLAFSVRYTNKLVASVIDARRGEVFYALYRQVPGGTQRVSEFAVANPQHLAAHLEETNEDVLMVGDGAIAYRDQFTEVENLQFSSRDRAFPSASSLVQLAHAQALREEFQRPDDIHPLYLRAPDAVPSFSGQPGVTNVQPSKPSTTHVSGLSLPRSPRAGEENGGST